MHSLLRVTLILVWLFSHAVNAEPEKTVKSGVNIVATNPLTVVLGLLFVCAMIFALAWLLRRIGAVSMANGQSMKVVAGLSVGTRERIVLVDVAGKQILIGVAPGRVSSLHYFDEAVVDAEKIPTSEFASKMKRLLQQQTVDPKKSTDR